MPTDQPNRDAIQSAQPAEYQECDTERKLTGKPKTAIKKRNGTTARVCGKRKGYRPRARNALYSLAAEYKRRHPKATAAEAWAHFCTVAEIGAHDVVLAHDSAADTLTYHPDPGRFDTRTIKQDSFARRWRDIV